MELTMRKVLDENQLQSTRIEQLEQQIMHDNTQHIKEIKQLTKKVQYLEQNLQYIPSNGNILL